MSALAGQLALFAVSDVSQNNAERHFLTLSLLDWLACGRAGLQEPVSQIVSQMALDEEGRAEAHIFGAATAVPARAAALVNGTVSHALDYDDTHFAHIGHPSVVIFSAALSTAEASGRSIAEMIDAAMIGFEAAIRIGVWLGRAHYQVGYHQTATAGAFGAALAACRLMGMTKAQTQNAIGLVSTRAAGLKSQFGTMGKPYNAGLGAAAGVEAAQLAARGMIANPAGLDGPLGFGETHHGAGDLSAFVGLGADWLLTQTRHKFHACCHGLHAALEAAALLPPLTAAAQPDWTIRTHPRWMSVCNQPDPDTGLGAKFSYATVIALRALGHDTGALTTFSDALATDPQVAALRARVTVLPDDTLTEMQAVVRRTANGLDAEARFDLDLPLPVDEIAARLERKAHALIGPSATQEAQKLITSEKPAAALGAWISGS